MSAAGIETPATRLPRRGGPIARGGSGAETPSPLRRVCAGLYVLDVAVLFTLAGGLLWELGLNYDGITGAAASKIHPATYLAVVTFGLLLLARPNPASMISTLAARDRGPSAMLAATGVALALAAVYKRPGLAGLIDTFCLTALLSVIASEVGARAQARAEPLLHALLGVNASLTIFEFVTGTAVIPYRFDGETLYEMRPAGLQGHAVSNAPVIGTYLTVLLVGGGRRLTPGIRAGMVVLQSAALVASEQRAATVLAAAVICVHATRAVLRVLTGGRIGRPAAACLAAAVPLAAVALAGLWAAGTFDSFLRRFSDDGGSAMSRVYMLAIFDHLPWHELLIAPDVETVEAKRRAYGLDLGIENPIVRFILYHGALTTVVLGGGLACWLRALSRRLRPGHGWPFFYFLVVIMTYESIGTKSTMLAKFAVLMMAMFPPDPDQRGPRPPPRATIPRGGRHEH